MSTHTPTPPRRLIDNTKARLRDQLMTAMADTRTPCQTDPELWHSPHADDLQLAARHCREHCPLITLCDQYATADPPELIGVWGGHDRAQLAGRKRTCPRCRTRFRTTNTRRIYCTDTCARQARNQRRRDKEQSV